MPTQADDVLNFWFGAPGEAEYGTQRRSWFSKDALFDAEILRRFGQLIDSALAGHLAHWAQEPAAALAQVLLLDQFTRNAFRNTAQAFSGDLLALAAAEAMLSARQDLQLPPIQRSFVYLPFEHAESESKQDTAVRLFSVLAMQAAELQSMLEFAQRHRAVIVRFGRFPHRNALLGRASTQEERAFLALPGSSF